MKGVYEWVGGVMVGGKGGVVKDNWRLKEGRVVEMGRGRGYFGDLMEERGWEVCGMEKRGEGGEFGKEEFEVDVGGGEGVNELGEKWLDVIRLWDVMEDVEDLNERWERVKGIVKDEGIVIIGVGKGS